MCFNVSTRCSTVFYCFTVFHCGVVTSISEGIIFVQIFKMSVTSEYCLHVLGVTEEQYLKKIKNNRKFPFSDATKVLEHFSDLCSKKKGLKYEVEISARTKRVVHD